MLLSTFLLFFIQAAPAPCDAETYNRVNHKADDLFVAGQYREANLAVEELLAEPCVSTFPMLRAAFLNQSAVLLSLSGEKRLAASRIGEALKIYQTPQDRDEDQFVLALNTYAELLTLTGKPVEASKPLEEALARCGQGRVAGSPCIKSRINYGLLFLRLGDPEGGMRQFVRAKDLIRPADDPTLLLTTLIGLARSYTALGKLPEGDASSLEALDLVSSSFHPGHPLAGQAWETRVSVLKAMGRRKEAHAASEKLKALRFR